jgi:hypothetical protein
MSDTEYGFRLLIKKGDNARVEIDGYCSEVDKNRLLSVALKTYDTELRPFVGLTVKDVINEICKQMDKHKIDLSNLPAWYKVMEATEKHFGVE